MNPFEHLVPQKTPTASSANPFGALIPGAIPSSSASPTVAPTPKLDSPFGVVGGTLGEIGKEAVGGIGKAIGGIGEATLGAGGQLLKGDVLGAGGKVIKGGLDIASGALRTAWSPVSGAITESVKQLNNATGGKLGEATSQALSQLEQSHPDITNAISDFVTKHPDVAGSIGDIVDIIGSKLGVKAAPLVTKPIVSAVEKATPALEKTIETARPIIQKTGGIAKEAAKATAKKGIELTMGKDALSSAKNIKGTLAGARAVTKDIAASSKIQDIISPKLTAKETKLALKEGRIVAGQDPTLLQDGTPDSVIPSKETARAAQTVKTNIPNAENMKPQELYTALKNKIGSVAKSLTPKMKKVDITPETVNKITNDWTALKEKQLSNPYTSSSANVEKLQEQFEGFLQKSKAGNLNDLWDTAKAYDASVPSSVKNATSLSSDVLQAQKSMWLQNRGILKGAINSSSVGLGKVSQKAFEGMTDMYNAQEGIMSKIKVGTEAKPSKLLQFAKEHPYITGSIVGGAATATGIPQGIAKSVTGL